MTTREDRNISMPPFSTTLEESVSDSDLDEGESQRASTVLEDSYPKSASSAGLRDEEFLTNVNDQTGRPLPNESLLGSQVGNTKNDILNADIVKKAVTYSTIELGSEKSEKGVRQEQSVLDNLRHENFQLKLRIVVIESQLNQASGEGVADLRKKLAEAQAARISAEHENSRLRSTLSQLNTSRDQETDQVVVEKDLRIKALEEEILFFQEELQELRAHCDRTEQAAFDRESQYEDALRQERLISKTLRGDLKLRSEKKTDLEHSLDIADTVSDLREQDFDDMFRQAEAIKRAIDGNYSHPHDADTFQIHSYKNASQNFSMLLRQIKEVAVVHNAKHQDLQADFEKLSHSYEVLLQKSDELDSHYATLLDEVRHNHETDIQFYESELKSKEVDLQRGREEIDSLWEHLETLKSSISELENLKQDNTSLASQLSSKQSELFEVRSILNAKELALENSEVRERELGSKLEPVLQLDEMAIAKHELLVHDIMAIVKEGYNAEANEESLIKDLKRAFKLVSDVQSSLVHMNETMSENHRLSNELESLQQRTNNIVSGNAETERELSLVKVQLQEKSKMYEEAVQKLSTLESNESQLRSQLEIEHESLREAKASKLKALEDLERAIERAEALPKIVDSRTNGQAIKANGIATSELKSKNDQLSSEAKELQERLYYEVSRNELLEKQISSLSRHSAKAVRSHTLGPLDVAQTFKQLTYNRMSELQTKLDDLELEKKKSADKLIELERIFCEIDAAIFNDASGLLRKLQTQFSPERIKAITARFNELQALPSKHTEKIRGVQRLLSETVTEFTSMMTLKVNELQKETEYERPINLSPADKLLQPNELVNVVPANSSVRKDILKHISGSFVGKIWLSRYHEMEKRWNNERETRRREYDGYKQHLNECYERIETQKRAVHKLQLRIQNLQSSTEDPK